jgi:ubiquinone/menaquinone biosynthesis C-methylase UbiE
MNSISLFKALADKTRLRLFSILSQYELNVNEIVHLLNMGQSRVSRHLKILADSGLVHSRRDGLWMYYSLKRDNQYPKLREAVTDILLTEAQIKSDIEEAHRIIKERSLKTKSFFNAIAGDWERLKKNLLGNLDLNRKIAENIKECEAIVDIGCGTGDLIPYLLEKSRKVIGIDSSPKMLEEARKRFEGKADIRLGEIEHLPMADCLVDYAVFNMVLHHLSDPSAGISEACRIMKSGASLIITDFEKHSEEGLREKYGDRWLGFTKKEMGKWTEPLKLLLTGEKGFAVNSGLKINLFMFKKTIS